MRVRAYDKVNNRYFKSEVFAIINSGWYEKRLLSVPSTEGIRLAFFDCLDKSDKSNLKVLINTITPEFPSDWIQSKSTCVDTKLPGYEGLLDDNIRFFEYWGWPRVLEDKSRMVSLLQGNCEYIDHGILGSVPDSRMANWNYVDSQADADDLLDKTASFHDSVLSKMHYVSGAYVDNERRMFPNDNVRQVTMTIESQICGAVEMVFEGVVALNLRPAGENCTSDIFSASLFVQNESVFFCDEALNHIDTSYTGSWVTAYSLRYRFR